LYKIKQLHALFQKNYADCLIAGAHAEIRSADEKLTNKKSRSLLNGFQYPAMPVHLLNSINH
jgi:hypothetical protein